jgi:hypothetical protein
MHEQVDDRTGEGEQPRNGAEQMSLVFGPKVEPSDHQNGTGSQRDRPSSDSAVGVHDLGYRKRRAPRTPPPARLQVVIVGRLCGDLRLARNFFAN